MTRTDHENFAARLLFSLTDDRPDAETFSFSPVATHRGNAAKAMTAIVCHRLSKSSGHIPYRGPETNHPHNGLLLRADLHTLFDLKLIAIDVATMHVLISPQLEGTCFEQYAG